MTLFASLLVDCPVSIAETGSSALAPLYPAELAAVERAVERRRREFATGRECARRALRQLGCSPGPIPVLPSRAPAWPHGVVGSITHCDGLVAAAVGDRRHLWGLGIDAEPRDGLDAQLTRRVCFGEELAWMDGQPVDTPWATLFFSAKESVYKCVAPASGIFLEFSDVSLQLRHDGTFRATSPRIDLSLVLGRWAMSSTHITTAALAADCHTMLGA